MSHLVVAIDGPSGSGKSTVARKLAESLSLRHIDTGAMYRALALKALLKRIPLESMDAVAGLLAGTTITLEGQKVLMDGRDVTVKVRSPEVTEASSKVAQHDPVRRWMVEKQRKLVKDEPGGAVVEGRDIGGVVLPDAVLKVFLTASMAERARRRASEDSMSTLSETLSAVQGRDRRDMTRAASPLEVAPDAVVIDTTELSADEVVAQLLELITAKSS